MRVTGRLVVSILGAILGMFYFGYNSGVINAPEQSIKTFITKSYESHYDNNLTESTLNLIFGTIVSAYVVGGMAGAMMGGYVAERLGRKRGLIFSQVIGVLGAV